MANSDERDVTLYEPDAFDNPPKGPVGVHRGNRSAAARFLPPVAVVVVAALCGLLAWGVLSGEINAIKWPWSHTTSQVAASSQSDDDAAAKKTAAAKKAKKEAAAKKQAQKEAEQQAAAKQHAEEEAARQAAQVNKDLTVRVINGTGTTGYAAEKKATLDQAGYTQVTAANPTGSLPSATVVWYQNEDDKATAQDIANTLGIADVEQTTGLSSSIVVVLLD